MKFEVKGNVLTAFGTINDGDGLAFVSAFSELEQTQKPITIKLHTYGGSVFDGNMMYNAIINSSNKVIIHIVGVAASMGAVLSLAIEDVYMVENGYLMIHAPSGGAFGTANDLEGSIKLLRSIEANFIKKLQQKTGKNEAYVKAWLNGDNWFDAEQALQEGLIKGIIEPEIKIQADFNPSQLTTKEAFNRFSALFKSKNNINSNNMDLRERLVLKFHLRPNSSDTKIMEEVEKTTELRDSLISLLQLDSEASDEEILKQIESLINSEQTATEEKEAEALHLITQAKRSGKITAMQEPHILNMFKADFKGAKQFLNDMPKRVSISSMIVNERQRKTETESKPKSDWTLDDYRKHAPNELATNPELYQKLIKAQFNTIK